MRLKRLTAILLCLCMALTLLPTAALAAAVGETIHVGGVELTTTEGNPTVYAKTDDNGVVSTTNADENDYNIMWDGTTLTLNNADITQVSHENAAISYYNNDPGNGGISQLDLVLVGENTVTGPNLDPISGYSSYGILVAGDSLVGTALTISGAGSLTATGGTVSKSGTYWSAGICNSVGDISVEGGTVKATGGPSSGRSAGIHSQYKLTISGGTVNAAGGESESSYGIYSSSRGITISGGTVTAEGATQAVRTTGTVTVAPEEDQQIAVTAGESETGAQELSDSPFTETTSITSLISSAKYFHSIAEKAGDPGPDDPNIYVGGVELTGDKDTPAYALTDKSGKVTIEGASATGYTIMWDGETLTLNNAVITRGSYKGAAIYCGENAGINLVLVGDSTVTGPGGDASRGIYTSGDLTISGDGTLDVSGGGISLFVTGDLTISDGTVTATGGDVSANDAYSYGIFTPCDITISGGSVTAEGGTASTTGASYAESCGIFAHNVTISGGTVNADGGAASAAVSKSYACSYGIYADNVTISGGEVTATGGTASAVNTGGHAESYGIYVYGRSNLPGSITISGGIVNADGGKASVTAADGISVYGSIDISDGIVNADGGQTSAEDDDTAISIALLCTTLTISGGTVNATGGTATGGSEESYGLSLPGTFTISGGTVTIAGKTASFDQSKSILPNLSVLIAPQPKTQIRVQSGPNQGNAAEITGSPFQEETEIVDLASAAGVA